MRPGSTVKREASITSASGGRPALGPAVVTASIRPLSISTAASRTGGAPVPSMSVPARRIFISCLPGWRCPPRRWIYSSRVLAFEIVDATRGTRCSSPPSSSSMVAPEAPAPGHLRFMARCRDRGRRRCRPHHPLLDDRPQRRDLRRRGELLTEPARRRGRRVTPRVVELVAHARRELAYGASRTQLWLRRVHDVRVAMGTIQRIFRDLGIPRLRRTRKRVPRQLKLFEKAEPGESVQV